VEADFPAAAGQVNRIRGQGQAGYERFQFTVNSESFRERDAEVLCARGKVELKQIIGCQPQIEAFPKQCCENCGIVVDAAEQHRLHMDRNAGTHARC
jgi:hypothetical protein